MGVLHFLNVGQGDCSIIEHASGRISVIDVCKARAPIPSTDTLASILAGGTLLELSPNPATNPLASIWAGRVGLGLPPIPERTPLASIFERAKGNPPIGGLLGTALKISERASYDNPVQYMKDRGISAVFRFILSHPDMDHMDGIKDIFEEFTPANFWDTDNRCEKSFAAGSPYREGDWLYYKELRNCTLPPKAKRLTLYAGERGAFFNEFGKNGEPMDGLYLLAPTKELVAEANRTNDFNDASYVILYRSLAGRILFCGDSHDKTWEFILENYRAEVEGVDLMIAPHHGRDSGRDRTFLDVVRPKFTLFGVAPSQDLAYDAWRNRNLSYITNNQAGTIVIEAKGSRMEVFVSKEPFARKRNPDTYYSTDYGAWHLGYIA